MILALKKNIQLKALEKFGFTAVPLTSDSYEYLNIWGVYKNRIIYPLKEITEKDLGVIFDLFNAGYIEKREDERELVYKIKLDVNYKDLTKFGFKEVGDKYVYESKSKVYKETTSAIGTHMRQLDRSRFTVTAEHNFWRTLTIEVENSYYTFIDQELITLLLDLFQAGLLEKTLMFD